MEGIACKFKSEPSVLKKQHCCCFFYLGSDLVAALAGLQVHNLAHGAAGRTMAEMQELRAVFCRTLTEELLFSARL